MVVNENALITGARLIVERASADAVTELKQSGLRAILLKGPIQQDWLSAAGAVRASTDVDLLLPVADLERGGVVLENAGYGRLTELPADAGMEHSEVWVSPTDIQVELHWAIVGADERRLWPVLEQETERAAVGDTVVEIPNESARCLIVALHVAQHGIGDGEILNDLERALAVAQAEVWKRAYELAIAVGAETAFISALSFTAPGAEHLESWGVDPPELTERQALSLITPAPAARGFYFLSEEKGIRAKVIFVGGKLVPSPSFMRLRYPMARRGPAGLTMAYAYRPFWLLRWVVPGFRSWRAARALAENSRRGEIADQARTPEDH